MGSDFSRQTIGGLPDICQRTVDTVSDSGQEKGYLSQIKNVFLSNCEMYFSQIAKCICFILQNVFVSN